MTEVKQPVIIGDEKPERADWLAQFFNDYYNASSIIAENFDKVLSIARGAKGSVIVLSDTLPYSYDHTDATTNSNFIQLEAIDRGARLACVVTGEEMTPITGVRAPVCYLHVPSEAPTPPEVDRILRALESLADRLPPATTTVEEVARLTRWARTDRRLHEQILSLSHRNNIADAERHLHRLLRDSLDFANTAELEVKSLTPGKSGALVFRVHITPLNLSTGIETTRDFVLKITRTEEVWKLQSEVHGYLQASKSRLYTKYKTHIPALRSPRSPSSLALTNELYTYIVSSLPWDAIHYDFLGGDLGECMSLSEALIAGPMKIKDRTRHSKDPRLVLTAISPDAVRDFRLKFLDTFLEALSDVWYVNNSCRSRKKRILWQSRDAHDRQYDALPPYRLTALTKYWLEEFLDSAEAEIGLRMLPEFSDCRRQILKLVRHNKKSRIGGFLGQSQAVTLTPVHGDLNASNAFLWLNEKAFPFVIDLPFFQREGHMVQDFARLEVEVKFALMDEQEESPAKLLPAFDQTSSQMALWRDMETHLLKKGVATHKPPRWRAPGFGDNVDLTYQLVKIIRDRAKIAQQKTYPSAPAPLPFLDEYLPALLYHTLRAITYPSLSIFKRLLAVHSAGTILERLGV